MRIIDQIFVRVFSCTEDGRPYHKRLMIPRKIGGDDRIDFSGVWFATLYDAMMRLYDELEMRESGNQVQKTSHRGEASPTDDGGSDRP